jgi:hypothetical protein
MYISIWLVVHDTSPQLGLSLFIALKDIKQVSDTLLT